MIEKIKPAEPIQKDKKEPPNPNKYLADSFEKIVKCGKYYRDEEDIIEGLSLFLNKWQVEIRKKKALLQQKQLKKKENLLYQLNVLAKKSRKSNSIDEETKEQMQANDLLLGYINDDQVKKVFNMRYLRYPVDTDDLNK